MADTGKPIDSLRFNRFDLTRVIVVLALSLGIHLIGFGGYELSKQMHLFPWLRWLAHTRALPPPVQSPEPVEFTFVQHPATEAPKNAKYYGAKNSAAADQSHGNQAQPQVNGTQTEMPNTEVAGRTEVNKFQPPIQQDLQPTIEAGDLTLVKNPPSPQPQTQPQKLSQVQPRNSAAPQTKQNGGVQRLKLETAFDVKATPFGSYDAAVFDAIQQYWNNELDRINYDGAEKGKVVVQFHLNYDGHISDTKILQTTEGTMMTLMCQLAIENPAPYAEWSPEMHHVFGNFRVVTITFFYN